MGLKQDIEETRELWKESSLLFKVVILLSTFLTISTITSLADVIFGWKGFILDAVIFYRTWITALIGKLLGYFGIYYTRSAIDYLTLVGLLNVSAARWAWLEKSMALELWAKVGLTSIYVVGSLFSAYRLAGISTEISGWSFLVVLLFFLLTPVVLKYKELVLWYGPLLAAIMFASILGAINAGLIR